MMEEKLLLKHLKIFSKSYPYDYSEYEPPKSDSEEDDKFYKELSSIDNNIDHELIKKYFKKESLLGLFKHLKPSYNIALNNAKNTMIEVNLLNLINDIKIMSDDEVKSKNLDLIAYSVRKILDTNKEKQQGQGLEILTPKQMIIRLPILLAQLKTGSNPEKLKNEIRQIVYSLYRSKNLSETIYNNLVNAI